MWSTFGCTMQLAVTLLRRTAAERAPVIVVARRTGRSAQREWVDNRPTIERECGSVEGKGAACLACTKNHSEALAKAGCTSAMEKAFCESAPPSPPHTVCRPMIEKECGSVEGKGAACLACTKDHSEALAKAGCTSAMENEFCDPTFASLPGPASTTHYEDPNAGPCMEGETAVQITGLKGSFCSPKCELFRKCTQDVPAGTTAEPKCVLETSGSTKPTQCALICTPSTLADGCPTNASCKSISGTGLCTYDQ